MKKSLKKVLSLALMTALLATAVIGAIPASAQTYDNTLTLTINGTNCSTLSNNLVLYTNDTDSVRVIKSTDYRADNFRYSKIMIFNKDGRLIEAGGDLTHVDGINGSAQEYINIPAGGFAIAFNPSAVSNLKKCFDVAMEGAVLYNATMSVIHEVIGSYSGNTLTIKYNNATAAPEGAKKFLFVGNSSTYFNGTPIKFKGLAQSAGVDVDVVYCTYGSAFLYEYANASHERGKAFRNHLRTGNFDYVVLQDGGTADYSDSKPAVSVLLPLIKDSGAEALLYMRYSSNSDPAQRFMSARKHYINYTRLSREYGLNVSPAATSFLICTDKYPEINLYATDNSHHSKEGSYLIACTWLYSYLGIDPVGVEYDADLGSDVAAKLQECAKLACEEEYDYQVKEEDLLPDEDVYYVNGNKYESITVNKPYTTNGTAYSGTWTEHNEDGTLMGKYTNGIYADDNGSSSAIGCVKGAKINVDIDLKGKYDIKAFRTQLYGNPGWGIPNPFDTAKNIYVEFSVSNDGKNYTLVGKADAIKAFDDGAWTKAIYTLEPKEKTEARYIRATFYNTGFLWCDEISAYGVEGGNIALNKDYTVSGVGERKDSYCAKLNDGIATDKVEYSKGEESTWFGFYYHTNYTDINAPNSLGTVTYDFEKLHTIDKVRVHTLFGNTSGIKSPQYISVETSEDGITFTEAAKQTYSPSSGADVKWAEIALEKPVDARFVRVCVKLDGTFAFINEIEIYGEEKTEGGNDDEEEPVIGGENIALNKEYTTHSPLDGYNAKLTDGIKSDKMAYSGDVWYVFKCHPNDASGNTDGNRTGTVIIDLDGSYDLSGVKINAIYNDASGISRCSDAKVYLSEDGKTWSEATSLNLPNNSDLFNNDIYAIEGVVTGTASFVKIELTLGEKTFLFFDEIEIFGAPASEDDEPIDPPVDPEPEPEPDPDNSFEEALKEQLGTAFDDAKLDFVIDAPESYKAGDEITVTVTVNNVTAESGVHMVEFKLYYDNEKLVLTNDLDEADDNTLICIKTLPEGWENLSYVNNDFVIDGEEGAEVKPLNDGVITAIALTTSINEADAITEDGKLVFEFTFKVLDGAEGDLGFVIPHAETDGALNTKTDIEKFNANGGYAIVTEAELVMLGDVNGDETIDKYDYLLIKRHVMGTLVLGADVLDAADVNGDDKVDKYDYLLVKRHVMGTYVIEG